MNKMVRIRQRKTLSIFIAFIDLEKAFDCIDRNLLLYRLLCHNIDGKFYNTIKRIYTDTSSCLKINSMFTDWFNVLSGVRQGDNLSPTLFGLFINDLAKHIQNLNIGVKVGQDKISIFLFADDMVLVSENEHDLHKLLNAMLEWTNKWRLKVNIAKSKIVHFRKNRSNRTQFEFKYGQDSLDI